MEKMLEKAFKKVSSLPAKERQAFATFILEELESEKKWDELFKNSQSELRSLADEALLEHKKGNTEEINFNKH